ncbi:3'-5' exoribonuclease domain-containing protein [Telmatospirillum sp.]|uniref:3'-5' exoribonuclease domain-containing protein n=1 Tax=Telmatospirillum sp. TaxID=2079197 RepID=UPI00285045BB|nr:3'-5' exoribonuclease [Telmatospirillum sp.]MDR3436472.1 3'-5' exoribonuclease [Telmatospirillum sp.]
MTIYTDCMVDVETTGLESGRNAMIQIAAVKFNLETQEVSPEFFNRCLRIPPHRFWDEDTWNWWSNDKAAILISILKRAEDPALVMKDFVDWSTKEDTNVPTFWSKPSHFDFPFVASYCRDYGLVMPYDFRRANDMRSFMRGKAWPLPAIEPRIEFAGTAHNAIHDVLHQIQVLFEFVSCDHGQN